MLLDQSLCESQSENRDKGVERVHDAGTKTGNETGLMALAEGFLHDKNGNRTNRGRCTHSYEESL